MRRTILAAGIGLHAGLAASIAAAQTAPAAGTGTYPDRPVRLVAASAPGGGIDIIGRVVAQRLNDSWPQQVVVDNRAGSGGLIATGIVAKAQPDGYTLLMQSVGVSYVGTLHRNAPFDVTRDLVAVVPVGTQPSVLAVHASVPAASLGEFVKLARAKPGQFTFGTGGAGGASHMGTELFARAAGVQLVHVPYKGTGPSMAALLSGEVNLALVGVVTANAHVKAGKIRPLAVTGTSRASLMPEIPTAAEAGVPGYEFAGWYGIFAPAGTPRAAVLRINGDVNAVLRHPESRKRFEAIGVEPLGGNIEDFGRYFAAEVAKWRKVIREAGISAE